VASVLNHKRRSYWTNRWDLSLFLKSVSDIDPDHTVILFIQTLALYKSFTYLLLTYNVGLRIVNSNSCPHQTNGACKKHQRDNTLTFGRHALFPRLKRPWRTSRKPRINIHMQVWRVRLQWTHDIDRLILKLKDILLFSASKKHNKLYKHNHHKLKTSTSWSMPYIIQNNYNTWLLIMLLMISCALWREFKNTMDKLYQIQQEAQLLLGDRATRKHAKDSRNGRGNDNLGWMTFKCTSRSSKVAPIES